VTKRDLAYWAERAAQAVYDLRDAVPAHDTKLWLKLDNQAGWMSRYGAKCLEPKPKKSRHAE
jgi:hypothetical protein